MIYLTALLTGLLGSFHCVGMCGPIALATPTIGSGIWGRMGSKLVYHAGRVFMYSVLGGVFGVFGMGLKLAGMQQSISIAAGVAIIIGTLLSSGWLNGVIGNPLGWIKGNAIAVLFQRKSYAALWLIGMLNGLLPCGFVYIGLIGAVAMQGGVQGATFMALFGLGTTPLMFGVSIAGQFLNQHIRSRINKTLPYLAVFIGCLFILRGLNLGIPFVSPHISTTQTVGVQHCGE